MSLKPPQPIRISITAGQQGRTEIVKAHQLSIETVGRFMRTAPVDVKGLATALGLKIESVILPDNVSGKIECEKGGPCTITVNASHPRTRQRFTIAHEIAHFVLHRNLIGDGIEDDGRYRSRGLSDSIERQANSYAADILMPWDLVIARRDNGCGTPEALAKVFDVSPAVAEIRLKELVSLSK
jgi:hypothetical protein